MRSGTGRMRCGIRTGTGTSDRSGRSWFCAATVHATSRCCTVTGCAAGGRCRCERPSLARRGGRPVAVPLVRARPQRFANGWGASCGGKGSQRLGVARPGLQRVWPSGTLVVLAPRVAPCGRADSTPVRGVVVLLGGDESVPKEAESDQLSPEYRITRRAGSYARTPEVVLAL